MAFTLDAIQPANKHWQPQKILIYSVQGLGKTTFASTFEKPIIIRTEDGAGAIDVPTFPNLVTTFGDMEEAITSLHGEHDFKTVVLDSLDWLEPLCWRHVAQLNGKQSTITASTSVPTALNGVDGDVWIVDG